MDLHAYGGWRLCICGDICRSSNLILSPGLFGRLSQGSLKRSSLIKLGRLRSGGCFISSLRLPTANQQFATVVAAS